MTAYSVTSHDIPGRGGEVGNQFMATSHYALTGALVAADTITFTNLLPKAGGVIVAVDIFSPELDTDATPTGTWKVGNTDDDDGYVLTSNIGLPTQAPANGQQISHHGTGALIGTTVTNRDVVVTIVGVMATSATTGTIGIRVLIEGSPA